MKLPIELYRSINKQRHAKENIKKLYLNYAHENSLDIA
jgi:hypothetical protein